jgi:hypothetical protein
LHVRYRSGMRAFALFITILAAASCGSKSTPTTSGSAAGSATTQPSTGSGAVGSAGSAATSGSAVMTGSAETGSAGAGSAAKLDPKFESLDPSERRTCGIYATCKVGDNEANEPKEMEYENACLTVWVTLSAAEKTKIATCADAVGQCSTPPHCFDSMKL